MFISNYQFSSDNSFFALVVLHGSNVHHDCSCVCVCVIFNLISAAPRQLKSSAAQDLNAVVRSFRWLELLLKI
jgi:hypothetical protein